MFFIKNGSIEFQKNNGHKTALMRPFHRHLNIENQCRNKEMASYFAKMTFFQTRLFLGLTKMLFSQNKRPFLYFLTDFQV